ncbi:MAG TPA: AI-2E family transporter [Smithella sp.]|nr:AI-2E family transporter [Smithella sp.]
MANLRSAATQSTGEAVSIVSRTIKGILSGGSAIFDVATLIFFTPITAFYVLRDWKKLTKIIDEMIPRTHYAAIREQLTEIDQTLSGFLRGQAIVCVILGFYYSVGLALSGLQYGATVGIIAGVLTIVPYVGTISGWIISAILACVQFSGDWLHIGVVMAVFIVGNFVETYVLSPRLVGSRVKLHTVWVLFALMAGGELLGFTGVLIAVPCAAVLGVLVRFGAKLYKSSAVYR